MEPVETACVCTTLRMATRSVARLYDRALREAGLRQAAYAILSRIDAEGPLTISQLADRLVLERTTCSREVEVLVKAGLVTAETGSDRRLRILGLSPEGVAKLRKARQRWREVQQGLQDAFGVGDTNELLTGLRTLLRTSEHLIGNQPSNTRRHDIDQEILNEVVKPGQ
ncbi:MarR family winged helix-turn-helix transcriptional regulator [Nocardia gipuzkoensis]